MAKKTFDDIKTVYEFTQNLNWDTRGLRTPDPDKRDIFILLRKAFDQGLISECDFRTFIDVNMVTQEQLEEIRKRRTPLDLKQELMQHKERIRPNALIMIKVIGLIMMIITLLVILGFVNEIIL